MAFDASVHAKAIELTKLSIEMTTAAGSGHPTSAASLSHLVTVLLYSHMRHEPANPSYMPRVPIWASARSTTVNSAPPRARM
jgi:transketolase